MVGDGNVGAQEHILGSAIGKAIVVGSAGDIHGAHGLVLDIMGHHHHHIVPPDAARNVIVCQPLLAGHVQDVASEARASDGVTLEEHATFALRCRLMNRQG